MTNSPVLFSEWKARVWELCEAAGCAPCNLWVYDNELRSQFQHGLSPEAVLSRIRARQGDVRLWWPEASSGD